MMQKIILLLILFSTVSIFPVFAEQLQGAQTIFLFTDKTAYYEGDVITVTGYVDKVVEGLDMSIQIFAESGVLVDSGGGMSCESRLSSSILLAF